MTNTVDPAHPFGRKAVQLAVIDPVAHGLDMLYSEGSADCAK